MAKLSVIAAGISLTVMLAACGQQFSSPTSQVNPPTTTVTDEFIRNSIWTMSDDNIVEVNSQYQEFILINPSSSQIDRDAFLRGLIFEKSKGLKAQVFPSIPEALACAQVGIADCTQARVDSVTAVHTAPVIFYWQTAQDDNERNAFQHAFWNALMSKHITAYFANQISYAHEKGSASFGTHSSNMDITNNNQGQRIGGPYYAGGFISDVTLASMVVSDMKVGRMVVLDRPTKSFSVNSSTYINTWQPITKITVVY